MGSDRVEVEGEVGDESEVVAVDFEGKDRGEAIPAVVQVHC